MRRRFSPRFFLTGTAFVALCLTAGPAAADEEFQGPNIVEFFLGSTRADHRGANENALAVGAQYRYAFSEGFSFGVLGEYSRDPFDAWILGAPAVFSPGNSAWQFTAMPGIEFEGRDQKFLFRAGVGYEFEMPGYLLKPEINVDWVDGNTAIVGGLSIGFRF